MISIICVFCVGLLLLGFYEIFLVPPFIFLLRNKCISRKLPKSAIILFVFIALYYSFGYFNGFYSAIGSLRDSIACVICYYIGLSAVVFARNKRESTYNNIIIAYSSGMFAHALLNVIYTFSIGKWGVTANIYDFWTRQLTLSTYQSTLMVMGVALAIWLLMLKKKRFKVIGTIILIIDAIVSSVIGSRSLISIVLFTFVFAFGSLFLFTPKYKKTKFKILLLVSVMVVGVLIAYVTDFYGVRTSFESSYLFQRFSLEHSEEHYFLDLSSRSKFYKELYSGIIEKPFGGIQLTGGASAHNSFLDIFRVSGVLSFIVFVIYIFKVLIKLVRMIRKYGMHNHCLLLISLEVFAILLIMMVESVFSINRNLVYGLLMICGIIDSLYININEMDVKQLYEF